MDFLIIRPRAGSGVAKRGDKWGHVPWGVGLEGAPAQFLQSFKNAF